MRDPSERTAAKIAMKRISCNLGRKRAAEFDFIEAELLQFGVQNTEEEAGKETLKSQGEQNCTGNDQPHGKRWIDRPEEILAPVNERS